jgi:hypothetical protein
MHGRPLIAGHPSRGRRPVNFEDYDLATACRELVDRVRFRRLILQFPDIWRCTSEISDLDRASRYELMDPFHENGPTTNLERIDRHCPLSVDDLSAIRTNVRNYCRGIDAVLPNIDTMHLLTFWHNINPELTTAESLIFNAARAGEFGRSDPTDNHPTNCPDGVVQGFLRSLESPTAVTNSALRQSRSGWRGALGALMVGNTTTRPAAQSPIPAQMPTVSVQSAVVSGLTTAAAMSRGRTAVRPAVGAPGRAAGTSGLVIAPSY